MIWILFCFDSILVRLKVPYILPQANEDTGFDSILVRLKAGIGSRKTIHPISFDSILVRLKVKSTPANTGARSGFDSILVRLKADIIVPVETVPEQFRFHTGSIKSILMYLQLDSLLYVSIPYWFD